MKYFVLVLVILVCGLIYVREDQPALWNQELVALQVPDDSSSTNGAPGAASAPAEASTAAAAPARTPSATPEIISPDSTHFNPDHVKPVAQPGEETNAPATNAPDTNASSTNAPATNSPPTTP
jgi:hypothetical protein